MQDVFNSQFKNFFIREFGEDIKLNNNNTKAVFYENLRGMSNQQEYGNIKRIYVEEHILKGDLVEYNNIFWYVINTPVYMDNYSTAVIQQCNKIINLWNTDGQGLNCPVIIQTGTYTKNESSTVSTISGKITVLVQQQGILFDDLFGTYFLTDYGCKYKIIQTSDERIGLLKINAMLDSYNQSDDWDNGIPYQYNIEDLYAFDLSHGGAFTTATRNNLKGKLNQEIPTEDSTKDGLHTNFIQASGFYNLNGQGKWVGNFKVFNQEEYDSFSSNEFEDKYANTVFLECWDSNGKYYRYNNDFTIEEESGSIRFSITDTGTKIYKATSVFLPSEPLSVTFTLNHPISGIPTSVTETINVEYTTNPHESTLEILDEYRDYICNDYFTILYPLNNYYTDALMYGTDYILNCGYWDNDGKFNRIRQYSKTLETNTGKFYLQKQDMDAYGGRVYLTQKLSTTEPITTLITPEFAIIQRVILTCEYRLKSGWNNPTYNSWCYISLTKNNGYELDEEITP